MPKITPAKMRNTALRMPEDLIKAVEDGANAAGMSNSDFHRWALRSALERQAGDSQLAGAEERLAAELGKQARKLAMLRSEVQMMIGVMDTFVKFYLTYTPDMPDGDARTAARALGHRRYSDFMRAVPEAMSGPLASALQKAVRGGESATMPE
jgi:hypothetical protein